MTPSLTATNFSSIRKDLTTLTCCGILRGMTLRFDSGTGLMATGRSPIGPQERVSYPGEGLISHHESNSSVLMKLFASWMMEYDVVDPGFARDLAYVIGRYNSDLLKYNKIWELRWLVTQAAWAHRLGHL